MIHNLPRLALMVTMLSFSSDASAAIITQPTGLNPGDQYRLAFVTSTARDAISTNIADYNTFVTNVANTQPALQALGTTWSAIASTQTVAARVNTNTLQTSAGGNNGARIFLLSGAELATGNDMLWGIPDRWRSQI